MIVVASAANEAEADMIRARLADAGIAAESRRSIGGPGWGTAGARYIYVEPDVAARAKAILDTHDAFSDDELAKLSEESAAESAAGLAARESADPRDIPPSRARGAWGRILRWMRGG